MKRTIKFNPEANLTDEQTEIATDCINYLNATHNKKRILKRETIKCEATKRGRDGFTIRIANRENGKWVLALYTDATIENNG